MQKISFGNKQYVKASEAAKKFRYTQDYVGQLCRSKKVDARLVGRTWYVELDSVTEYRKTKHKTQKKTSAATITKRPKRNTSPKKVSPVIRSKTVKSTSPARQNNSAGVNISYGSDSGVAIPIVKKSEQKQKEKSATTPVTTSKKTIRLKSSSTKIQVVKSGPKKTKFKSEKIPEISLSGKLKVLDLTHEEDQLPTRLNETEQDVFVTERSARETPEVDRQQEKSVLRSDTPTDQAKQPTRASQSSKVTSFVPQHVQNVQTEKTKKPSRAKTKKNILVFSSVFFFSLLSGMAILSLSSGVDVSAGSQSSWSLFLDISVVKEILF